ncbi:hypothetical protein [uncultured Bacteroides sp.]|uniref:hypothetical protein n=1 Tax=uncultured Bacteroides sp. TaxID=162156 RepID=UPI002AABDF88|nr:hypothetical protein [uncultured Bacteroides sp.]
MGNGITISQKDDKGRTASYEFWFHDNFIAIHAHGFTDNETLAKSATRCRFIWGCWYFCFETFIPRFVFGKIVTSEECIAKFANWYNDAK